MFSKIPSTLTKQVNPCVLRRPQKNPSRALNICCPRGHTRACEKKISPSACGRCGAVGGNLASDTAAAGSQPNGRGIVGSGRVRIIKSKIYQLDLQTLEMHIKIMTMFGWLWLVLIYYNRKVQLASWC